MADDANSADTTTTDTTTADATSTAPEAGKTFTQEQVNTFLAEQKRKIGDVKELKAAAAELAALKESAKTEAQKTADRLAGLEAENAGYKAEKQVAEWRAEVSKATGVQESILRGSTKAEIEAHAEELKPLITKAEPPEDDGKPHVPYRDLSKSLADAPNPTPGMGTLRAAYANKQ